MAGSDTIRIDLKTLYQLLTGREIQGDFPAGGLATIDIVDGNGEFQWVTSGCEDLWGHSAADLIGRNVRDLERRGVWMPSSAKKAMEARRQVTLTQETCTGRLLQAVATPVYDGSSKISRVITGSVDLAAAEARRAAGEAFAFQSPAMRQVDRLVAKVAGLDLTVLIIGESGTGKGVLARKIHDEGKPGRPFIKIDCGALPANLLESELFGYEKGAFSGAGPAGKKALVELAGDGTLFLDEIGEIPLALQSKFLRLIQDKTYRKVGGTAERRVEATILAATHRDLKKMAEAGEFRQDLYYRLNVFPINLPPLRDLAADIPALAAHFCALCGAKWGRAKRFSPEALASLAAYPWPGNIRELENVVSRAVVLAEGETIEAADLPGPMQTLAGGPAIKAAGPMPLKEGLRLKEEEMLLLAWHQYGTTTGVARALGIDQSTASRKLRRLLRQMKAG